MIRSERTQGQASCLLRGKGCWLLRNIPKKSSNECDDGSLGCLVDESLFFNSYEFGERSLPRRNLREMQHAHYFITWPKSRTLFTRGYNFSAGIKPTNATFHWATTFNYG
jgi:hypothetical protein